MPEASVHEDGDIVVGQHEIGLTGQPAGLGGVANLESSRYGAHPPLGCGSFGRHTAHAL